MICFELSRNGKRLATAGLPGFAVLSAHITWVRRRTFPWTETAEEELKFHLGGLHSNDLSKSYHVKWVDHDAKVGDVFTLRVLEGDRPDKPTRRYRSENRGPGTGKKRIANLERLIAAHQKLIKSARLELRKARRQLAAKR